MSKAIRMDGGRSLALTMALDSLRYYVDDTVRIRESTLTEKSIRRDEYRTIVIVGKCQARGRSKREFTFTVSMGYSQGISDWLPGSATIRLQSVDNGPDFETDWAVGNYPGDYN